jgi:4-hydroxy-2-oxoheptanedioate aldolase
MLSPLCVAYMTERTLHGRMDDGEVVVGTFQVFDSVQVAEAVGVAGMDFVVFDQEHGPLTAETSLAMAAGAESGGAVALVRVRTNAPAEIQRGLDMGSGGVMVPQVENRADAERARDAARFSPLGERGLSQYTRAGRYAGMDDFTRRQNEETTLILQVEGEEAVEEIDEIVALDGVDVAFLGPYDLSQSLGIPGQVRDERVEALMEEVCEAAEGSGTAVGTYADDAEMARRWIDAGVQFVAASVDGAVLTRGLERLADGVRDE